MKKIVLLFLIACFLINCRKNDEGEIVNDFCLTTISGWPTMDFKTNYSIQVPAAFIGLGLTGFEGKSFYAASADRTIILYGGYNTGLMAVDFGDTLQNPVPKSIQSISTFSQLITLDQIETFYNDSQIAGIFFYANADHSWGRLYWKDGNVFKNALQIDFKLSDLETVNKIIQSIKRKN
jgi:hypothetical protein